MRKIILFAALMTSIVASAATVVPLSKGAIKKLSKAKAINVEYQSLYKGKESPGKTLVSISGPEVEIQSIRGEGRSNARPMNSVKVKNYIDYSDMKSYSVADLADGKVVSYNMPFTFGEKMKEVGKNVWMGLNCTIYQTVINSNRIEIWTTTELPFRGTPQPRVGIPDGLVLRVIRNGDTIQEAFSITELKNPGNLFPASWGENMDPSEFQYAINMSGVITVPIFDQQRINFDGAKLPEELKDGEIYNCAGGTIILKKVKLPHDISGRSVFAEVVQYSDGDAYDRTGSIFMIPTEKKLSFINALRDLKSVPGFKSGETDYTGLVSTPEYDVPLELMRFFTGFGVRSYNYQKVPGQKWVDSVLYETEITEIASPLKDEAWIGAYIGNWDSKGHKLSLKLRYYPDGDLKQKNVMPLFNTVNYIEQAGQPYPIFMLNDSLTVNFKLDKPVKKAMLVYTTTGHGGWGNGDEFNRKPNTIILDGKQVITFIPWRDDCGTYRNNNPCSGNFSNGLSSSDLSRSNWCPGTVTNPEYIPLGDLEAGDHTIVVKIPQGAPEGGSNSYWCVSGTLVSE